MCYGCELETMQRRAEEARKAMQKEEELRKRPKPAAPAPAEPVPGEKDREPVPA